MKLRTIGSFVSTALLLLTHTCWAGATDPIIFSITDARVDKDTHFLIVGLKVSSTNAPVMFTGYDPEYAIRINQKDYQFLGVTKWRHIFALRDIVELSTTNSYTRGYFYELTNMTPASVTSVQFKLMRDASKTVRIREWLKAMNIPDSERYTNLWSGVVETQVFELKQEKTSNHTSEGIRQPADGLTNTFNVIR